MLTPIQLDASLAMKSGDVANGAKFDKGPEVRLVRDMDSPAISMSVSTPNRSLTTRPVG